MPINSAENRDTGKRHPTGHGYTRREFLAGGAGLLLLASCGGTSDPAVIGQSAASGGGEYEGPPVELAFWNGFTGGDGPAMRELVDRFNDEHENISVDMVTMIWDPDFYQKTPAAVGSGNGPDVGIMHVDRLATNAARDVIVPLDEVADSLGLREEDFAPVAWESGFYDGQRYGIPLDVHPLGLYYNKKVMREAGLDPEGPPTTGDEYMGMLEEIKGNDAQGSWVSPFLFTGGFWFRTLVWQFGGELYDKDATRATYNSEEGVEALTWMVDLVKNGHSPQNVGQDADQVAFQNNENAFHWNGIWMLNAFKENPDLEWGVAPLPRIGSEEAAYANSHNFVLFNRAEPDENKLQASKVFMDWVTRNSLGWAEAGQIPARNSERESQEFEDLTGQSTLARQVPYLRFNPQITGIYEVQTVLDAAYNEAVLLVKDPRTALDEAAERADKLLEENRQKYGEVE